ncbi:hypothetical protein RFM26_04355 [Mesorhizobium sp. VK23B]|uniref:LysM domain-containing protein n=1 Tax=Mesorhizobium dulcispinae TaxID=3072316 RepID=A0ABU4XDK9_9HYPH|nr:MULTISPECIES: hypothetical protein [unclassified Mesorhizobium]MDX8464912.1 hypothetical protein [Mesorhizobium sp. VK23B]MDX8472871.1 hypothetical protein [Mesorhizobium sp. VK23A]
MVNVAIREALVGIGAFGVKVYGQLRPLRSALFCNQVRMSRRSKLQLSPSLLNAGQSKVRNATVNALPWHQHERLTGCGVLTVSYWSANIGVTRRQSQIFARNGLDTPPVTVGDEIGLI